jgi:hypothetical protein
VGIACTKALARRSYDGVLAPRGMRATFWSWADECTEYDYHVKEMAFARAINPALA